MCHFHLLKILVPGAPDTYVCVLTEKNYTYYVNITKFSFLYF